LEFLKQARRRSRESIAGLRGIVADIIDDVRANGDAALLRYNEKFDGSERKTFRLSGAEIERALGAVSSDDMADMRRAAENIRAFAEAQMEAACAPLSFSPSPGVTLGHRAIPVRTCCCYVPGGNYPLYSTALMLAIPAKVAGVQRVAACSPVIKGASEIHPKTVAAMTLAGVDEIYAVGGAHAIAAFSYGTDQISQVDLIVGPGNAYVSEAKRQCFGQVGIDFVAGPSEVLIIADRTADPDIIAADLLAQSEHDKLASAILVTTSRTLGESVISAVECQLVSLRTAGIAKTSWEDFGEVILAGSTREAADIANERAPEHLEVQTEDNEALSKYLYNYGSLFLGNFSAEVFGDYASGTNHTLPTMGAARYAGGVWAGTFLKICTSQKLDKSAMNSMAPLVSRMASGEGLAAHARAAELRMEKWKDGGFISMP
jgi:histidinol dehydrogenase